MDDRRIIVSLDFAEVEPALALLEMLDPALCRVKIGKELFTRSGPRFVEQVQQQGYDVFLDLKFHDIPATVAGACRAAADLGIWMLNVHASGGTTMLTGAREAIDKSTHKPLLVAVTVLTSLTDADLEQLGFQFPVQEQVVRLARLAHDCRLDGVVCSPREVTMLTGELGPSFKLVTPGIRPAGTDSNDQRRFMTPAEAVKTGSHYLVIGRPINRAQDPLAALKAIQDEINSVNRSSI